MERYVTDRVIPDMTAIGSRTVQSPTRPLLMQLIFPIF